MSIHGLGSDTYICSYYQWTQTKLETLAPEAAVALYLCDGDRQSVCTDEVAAHAAVVYPQCFGLHGMKGVPNTYFVVSALKAATSLPWRYVKGDCVNGWKLTRHGLRFAKNVERRKLQARSH